MYKATEETAAENGVSVADMVEATVDSRKRRVEDVDDREVDVRITGVIDNCFRLKFKKV